MLETVYTSLLIGALALATGVCFVIVFRLMKSQG
ncbi:unannotated protein [freshwater metagenome]|uniref:Unannotated protein n=1 Tax=freshwater metagenome TaxID=449393 RepID=A0A6J7SEF9_9ZZZZ